MKKINTCAHILNSVDNTNCSNLENKQYIVKSYGLSDNDD